MTQAWDDPAGRIRELEAELHRLREARADLYLAEDGGGNPTIWRRVDSWNDVAILSRRGGLLDEAFDRFAALVTA